MINLEPRKDDTCTAGGSQFQHDFTERITPVRAGDLRGGFVLPNRVVNPTTEQSLNSMRNRIITHYAFRIEKTPPRCRRDFFVACDVSDDVLFVSVIESFKLLDLFVDLDLQSRSGFVFARIERINQPRE